MPKCRSNHTILTTTKQNLNVRIEQFGLNSSYPLRKIQSFVANIDKYKSLESYLITEATIGLFEFRKFIKTQVVADNFQNELKKIYLGENRECTFDDAQLKKFIHSALEDLSNAGFDCLDTDNRLKNLFAQNLAENYMFIEGPIKRTKGKKKEVKIESDMLRRYPG